MVTAALLAGTTVAGVAATITTAHVVAAIVINTVIAAVLSYALGLIVQALAPKPKPPNLDSFTSQRQQRTSQVRQPVAPWHIIYGELEKSGPLTFIASSDDGLYLHIVITIACHPITEISTLFFNDWPIYLQNLDGDGNVTNGAFADHAKFQYSLGDEGAGVQPFPDLTSENIGWTNDHKQIGRAKFYVRLKFDRDIYKSIPNMKVRCKGKKVFDTRDSTTKFTLNPILMLRDYMTTPNSEGGLGASASEFDTTQIDGGANICEEFVATLDVAHTHEGVATTENVITFAGNDKDFLLFQTGDRVQLTTTGTLPTGLSLATNYYVIVYREQRVETTDPVTTNRSAIQLAATYDDCLAGNEIDITTEGTGTHTITKNAEPRYTAAGVIATDEKPSDAIENLRQSFAGRVVPVGGFWYIIAGAWTAPTITFDESDMADAISISTKVSRKQNFNAVKGVYISPQNSGQPAEYPPVINTTFEGEDNGVRIFGDIDMPFTTRPATAQRIAKIELFRMRRQVSAEIPLNLSGMQVQAGDTVMIDNTRLGWTAKTFEIASWNFNITDDIVLGTKLGIKELDSNVFDWDETLDEQVVAPATTTNLPNPFDGAKPPTDLMLESGTTELFVRQDGTVLTRLKISWMLPADAFVTQNGFFEIQFKKTSDSTWNTAPSVSGDVTFNHITDVEDGVSYDVRIRSVNHLRSRSEWAVEAGHTVTGKSAPPGDVESFTVEAGADGTRIYRWQDDDADADVKAGGGYKIRYTTGLLGSNYDTMDDLHEGIVVLSPFESNELGAGEYTFGIKAVDSSGNFSTNAIFVAITLPDPRLGGALFRINEASNGWPGTKVDCFVSATNILYAVGSTSGEIDDLPSAISSLSTSIVGMRTPKNPISYTTNEIDLGTAVTFRPIVTVNGTGNVVALMRAGDSTGSTEAFIAIDTVTAQYLEIQAHSSNSFPELNELTIIVDAPSQTEDFQDVDMSSTSNPFWFKSTGTGTVTIATKGGLSAITKAQITALQNTGGGWTSELITKSTEITSSIGPAAAFKVYDSNSSLADATIDVTLTGPRS